MDYYVVFRKSKFLVIKNKLKNFIKKEGVLYEYVE